MSTLTNFPNAIKVTLGTAWLGRHGLSQGVQLVLRRIPGPTLQYSEDGTDTPDSQTNRLKLIPYHSELGQASNKIQIDSDLSFKTVAMVQWSSTASYSFPQLWNIANHLYRTLQDTTDSLPVFPSAMAPSHIDFNPDVFSSYAAASVVELNIVDLSSGEIIVPDGAITPRWFGTSVVGNQSVGKVFAVENLGPDTAEISGVSVPDGFTIVSNLPAEIAVDEVAYLVVALSGAAAGEPVGQIEISYTTLGESQLYNFAVAGAVVAMPAPRAHALFQSSLLAGA